MMTDVYSVAPAGIFVPADSKIKTPEDLAGVPISVGYQSGSHYATVQALEPYLKPEEINLQLRDRHAVQAHGASVRRRRAGGAICSTGLMYFAEQLGFRKVIDTTFMIGTMIHGDPDPEDLRKFFRALRKAQRDIDLRPELYTHYYKNEFPDRFHAKMDTRRWGPGERLVFEPYTKEVYEESFEWIAAHGIFPEGTMGSGQYERATLSLGLTNPDFGAIIGVPTIGQTSKCRGLEPSRGTFLCGERSGILPPNDTHNGIDMGGYDHETFI